MLLLKPLLESRFQLRVHRETRLLPSYSLVISKNGPKIKTAYPGDTYPNGFKSNDGVSRPGTFSMRPGQLIFQALPMSMLAEMLSKQLEVPIVDKTGLSGDYDFTLRWGPENDSEAGPSIYTAIQEQLGLRLEAAKLPIECLVVDHVERPSPN